MDQDFVLFVVVSPQLTVSKQKGLFQEGNTPKTLRGG